MACWLLKTEPGVYSFADLMRDQTTTWDGIANAAALKNMRAMNDGDQVIIYHTGEEKSAVGLASVEGEAFADPKADSEKKIAIKLRAGKPLQHPVSLARIKADPAFAGWDLLRIGRLSVVPVPAPMWQRMKLLARSAEK